MISPVDRLHSEFLALILLLDNEPSLRVTVDDTFRKSLLLSATSYFEFMLTTAVQVYAEESSSNNELLCALIRCKAINRQYHTWFNWDGQNANTFYGLFGDNFRTFMKNKHKSQDWLDVSVRAFLELGRYRNALVHENFAAFTLEKTANELFESYKVALVFVEAVPLLLREYNGLSY